MSQVIVQVAVLTPLRKVFDYLAPEGLKTIAMGTRVKVPFGKQEKIGIVLGVVNESSHPLDKLKTIEAILDDTPLFSESLIQLIQWASIYYHTPMGEVFETALPSRLRKLNPPTLRSLKESPHAHRQKTTPPTLNDAQKQAIHIIMGHCHHFRAFLLHGVTGSGKTEVYLSIIQQVLIEKKQALIIVPEIGLTPQLLNRFQKRFESEVVTLHSSLTERQRYLAWEKARSGEASIIIGTRSATFIPLKNPGIFIIDEEHDPSLKQFEGFRYHARDVLMVRARLEKCPIILGSATPALETLHNVEQGKYQRLSLPYRAGEAHMPSIQIIDTRHQSLEEGLSTQVIAQMHKHLQQNNQVLLFINRRGYAPVLYCSSCQWMAQCQNCDAKMIVHFAQLQLRCHHCDATQKIPDQCPNCSGKNLHPVGLGTQRLEKILEKHFPNSEILRVDRDSVRSKEALATNLEKMKSGEAHILLGTQMIAKGHHLPNITCVAILDIDHALFSSDFRSLERLGQLITQVSGRSGRADKPGTVLLQTNHPHHPLLNQLLEQGYLAYASQLLTERKAIQLPPYSHQVLIRAEGKQPQRGLQFLSWLKKHSQDTAVTVLGPIHAPMERKQGQYRAQLLLQAQKRSDLHHLLQSWLANLEIPSGIRCSIDVDPLDMV